MMKKVIHTLKIGSRYVLELGSRLPQEFKVLEFGVTGDWVKLSGGKGKEDLWVHVDSVTVLSEIAEDMAGPLETLLNTTPPAASGNTNLTLNPLTQKFEPIQAVLMSVAGQEGNGGEEYNLMMRAAVWITELERRIARAKIALNEATS